MERHWCGSSQPLVAPPRADLGTPDDHTLPVLPTSTRWTTTLPVLPTAASQTTTLPVLPTAARQTTTLPAGDDLDTLDDHAASR